MTGLRSGIGWWKRPFDLVLAAVMLAPCLLVGAVVGCLVGLRLGRPILFIQERPGLRGRPFRMVKFRTMAELTEVAGRPVAESARLTSFGRWLRASGLDEIPEIWNVIRGEMSFVGPRPLLMEYLPLYDATQARRMDALPGITGWAQVNGRHSASWSDRFANDLWYVDHATPWLDVRILAMTAIQVMGQSDASPGRDTLERFRGNA